MIVTDSGCRDTTLIPAANCQNASRRFPFFSRMNQWREHRWPLWGLIWCLGILSACGRPAAVVLPTLIPTAAVPTLTPQPQPTLVPTLSDLVAVQPTAVWTPTPLATPSPTPLPTATATPDPYAGWTIADLASRSYGDGQLEIAETVGGSSGFTRYLITYPSDGLTIHGFMNVPPGETALPVVLVLHGFVNPAEYITLAYTTSYADALARAGYLVIHPNFRNHVPSDVGPNEFRAGYAIDVLNLVALIQQQAGQSGPLQRADPADISLWGHSMGGGIALRVLTVTPDIRAAVLYGSMSGDEYLNFQRIFEWTDGRSGLDEMSIPETEMRRIAPIYHLDRIETPLSIHHGTADDQVPPAWSDDLCQRLQELGKSVECFRYPGQPHTFVGEGDRLFRQRVLDFLAWARQP
jgi:dienelactone hydrolase